jgi:carboxymethylenebutenolidase
MIETNTTLTTAAGHMPTWIVHPDESGPFPMVIFYMDALGIREELRDMCRRIASVGYGVYLPNLYYRNGGPSFDAAPLARGHVDPAMMALNDALSMAMTVDDCAALLAHAQHNRVIRMPAAVIGFCMGGRHAIAAAAAYPQQILAMASLHGGLLVTERADSAHRQIARMQAEAYFAWAQDDPVAPEAHAVVVQQALEARGLPYRLEWHLGAQHGFTFPERFCYHKAAAERVWSRLFSLFRGNLSGAPSVQKEVA